MTHATATANAMRPPFPTERGVEAYNTKLGMWVFLASEVMFFTGLIGSYIVLRFGAPGEWARPGIVLNIPVTAFNTFLLICSSVSMVKAYAAIADGNQKMLKVWFLLTILGGAMFVGVQIYEYLHLVHSGFVPSGVREGSELAERVANGTLPAATMGLYGSTFYTMTGFHGFHVTCGVVSMTYLFFRKVLPGKYTQQDYRGVEVVGLYWHFVDLVWIILFTIVYLI
ncbi:MAG: heme-copper oxidase subunit III [Gemmatimonadetes bacterium]|nr:heme-copper oxidase subunit III [Gemmatimonadota bacterium]